MGSNDTQNDSASSKNRAGLVRRIALGLALPIVGASAGAGYALGGGTVAIVAGLIAAIGASLNILLSPLLYGRLASALKFDRRQ
jgi:hypothetical protein